MSLYLAWNNTITKIQDKLLIFNIRAKSLKTKANIPYGYKKNKLQNGMN